MYLDSTTELPRKQNVIPFLAAADHVLPHFLT